MARSLDRGWRIVWLALAWLGGVALQLQQPTLWPQPASAAVALVALVAFGLAALALRRRGPAASALTAVALALAAFTSTDWRAARRLAERLPPALDGQDIVVTGVVAELPRLSAIGTRFVFEVELATHAGAPAAVPRRLSFGWYHGYDGESLIASPPQALQAGDRWQLPLRLKQPHGVLNPHGFDLELWLFEQGIRASGYVRPGALWLADGVAHPVERLRQRIRDAILLRVADPSLAGVLAALAVGDQAAIERDEWDLFRSTGVAHLMSISGLHVTMFAWLAGGAASLLAGVHVRASTSSLADDHPLRARLPNHRRCDAGQRWVWDGVQFEVMHPPAADHALALKPNALSCVLLVSAADGRRLLLTGDIEAAQEEALVARLGAALRSDVLLVPHHGSRTSSVPAFIDAAAPHVAVVQAAYRSRFGHPAAEVVARYTARGVIVLRSDRCGAWSLPADASEGTCERQAAPRYWHHPAGAPAVPPD